MQLKGVSFVPRDIRCTCYAVARNHGNPMFNFHAFIHCPINPSYILAPSDVISPQYKRAVAHHQQQ